MGPSRGAFHDENMEPASGGLGEGGGGGGVGGGGLGGELGGDGGGDGGGGGGGDGGIWKRMPQSSQSVPNSQ